MIRTHVDEMWSTAQSGGQLLEHGADGKLHLHNEISKSFFVESSTCQIVSVVLFFFSKTNIFHSFLMSKMGSLGLTFCMEITFAAMSFES